MKLCVCENSDGWLVAWGLCEGMLIRSCKEWLALDEGILGYMRHPCMRDTTLHDLMYTTSCKH